MRVVGGLEERRYETGAVTSRIQAAVTAVQAREACVCWIRQQCRLTSQAQSRPSVTYKVMLETHSNCLQICASKAAAQDVRPVCLQGTFLFQSRSIWSCTRASWDARRRAFSGSTAVVCEKAQRKMLRCACKREKTVSARDNVNSPALATETGRSPIDFCKPPSIEGSMTSLSTSVPIPYRTLLDRSLNQCSVSDFGCQSHARMPDRASSPACSP